MIENKDNKKRSGADVFNQGAADLFAGLAHVATEAGIITTKCLCAVGKGVVTCAAAAGQCVVENAGSIICGICDGL